MDRPYFIYSLVDGNVGCFLLLAIEKNVAIKVGREDYLFSKHKSVPITLHSLQVLQSFMLRIKSKLPLSTISCRFTLWCLFSELTRLQ